MLFIWIAIFAYLLFAINAVIDKFLLNDKRIAHPEVYAFAIGILNIVAVVLVPFGFFFPAPESILLSLLAGSLFTFALLAFFGALKGGEASRIVPVLGGLVPLFTLVFARIFVGEKLSIMNLQAVIFLVGGTVLMSYQKHSKKNHFENLLLAGFAALLFALSFTLTKSVFSELGFINGFIWTRFGVVLGALSLLLSRPAQKIILRFFGKHERQHASPGLFISGQAIGAAAAFAQNYAIFLGSVTVVNALQGTQFMFLLLLTLALSHWFPRILRENFSTPSILEKIFAIILISTGIILLAIFK